MNCSVILCCAFAPRGQQTGTSRPQPRALESSLPAPRQAVGVTRFAPDSAVGVTRFAPDSARTASAQTHRVDPQEALVVLARMLCREKRTQRPRSGNLSECKDMGPLANVVEGNDPDIQEDARSVQPGAHRERGAGRLGAGGEHGSFSNSRPRSRARSRPRLPSAARSLGADAQVPSAGPRLHLQEWRRR